MLDNSPLPDSEGAVDSQFIQQQPVGQPSADEAILESGTDTGDGAALLQDEVVVSMTDEGFTPTAVSLPVGGTVMFVNNGQGLHWPASDVHPTHEILPDFDAKRGLTTGERYSYTFTEPGNWRFHDHLHPSFTGTINIE